MKKTIILLFTMLITFLACEKNPTEVPLQKTTQLDGIAFFYTILYETDGGGSGTQLYLYNNGETNSLFDDDIIRSMICVSPNGQTITFLKNALMHPWFGYTQTDNPVLTISNDYGMTCKEIYTDSSKIVALEWLDDNTIIASKYISDKPSFTILDTQGNVLIEKETPNLYKYFGLDDKTKLFFYNLYEFGIYNLSTDTWNKHTLENEISVWQPPFYFDNKLVLRVQKGEHISFNLNDNSFTYNEKPDNDHWLLYADSENTIYRKTDDYKNFSLYQNNTLISTVNKGEFGYDVSLFMTDKNTFYFQGEVGNDEGAFFKMDFDEKTVTKLTHHTKNQFILNCSYYQY